MCLAAEDDGVMIFESRAILRYIATNYASQGTDLLGKDRKTKALAETWLEAEHAYYNPPISSVRTRHLPSSHLSWFIFDLCTLVAADCGGDRVQQVLWPRLQ
jgi:glutathione S-transferase